MFGDASFRGWILRKAGFTSQERRRRRRPPPRTFNLQGEQLEDRSCPSGIVSISASTSSINEGTQASAVIQLSGTVSGNVTVNWQSAAGTATAGLDYTHASGSVQLSQSTTFAYVNVSTLTDATYDPNETFSIEITSITGDATLGSSSAQFTILDNQPPGGGGGGEPTSVSVISPGTLNEGQQFNLHAAVSPPGTYWVSGNVNWGTSAGMQNTSFSTYTMSDGSFWVGHQYYDDGPSPGNGTSSDVSNITVTIGALQGTAIATIVNVAPVGSGFDLFNDGSPVGGRIWRVEGTIQDTLPVSDRIDVVIDWGDGTPVTILEDQTTPISISQQHAYQPTGQTYTVRVTALDDDGGEYVWSKVLEMYLLDLDNDADGSGTIDAEDEEIEDTAPGAELYVNSDDDDENETPDMNEEGPIDNEHDLQPIQVRFDPSNNPFTANYFGWKLALVPSPGPALNPSMEVIPWAAILYENANKSNPAEYEQTPEGLGVVWTVGTEPISETLYVEARAVGTLDFALHLFNPSWYPVDVDFAVFTALARPPVDLDIFNGQFGFKVPDWGAEDKEVTIGAFTVANLNDTDGDTLDDLWDTDVVGNGITGRDEVDLMRLQIHEPLHYDGGDVIIRVVSGAVRFWTTPSKGEGNELTVGADGVLELDIFETFPGEFYELWVEATAVSGALRDIELRMEYGGESDTVKATAVWAELEVVEHDFKSYDELFAAGTPWNPAPTGFREIIEPYGGSGLRPYDSTTGIRNVIMFKWEVMPSGIGLELGAFGGRAAYFDVTRRVEAKAWGWPIGQGPLRDPPNERELPVMVEKPNDDKEEDDEFDNPPTGDRLYNRDKPGMPGPDMPQDREVVRSNFTEFVRVGFNKAPAGNAVAGSRASDPFAWHDLLDIKLKLQPPPPHELERNPNTVDGNENPVETTSNDIGPGHLSNAELTTPPT